MVPKDLSIELAQAVCFIFRQIISVNKCSNLIHEIIISFLIALSISQFCR